MSKVKATYRLDDRCVAILESVRDTNLLPSVNAALNFLILDYRRLQNEFSRHQSATKVPPKVDAAKA